MLGEKRLDGRGTAAANTAARNIGDGDPKSVAGFDVVIGGKLLVGENEDAGPGRSAIGFVQPNGRAGQQTAELHLKKRQTRGESRVAKTTLKAGGGGRCLRRGFQGELGKRTAVRNS